MQPYEVRLHDKQLLTYTTNIQSVIEEITALRFPHYYVFIGYGNEDKRDKENSVHLFDEFNVLPL